MIQKGMQTQFRCSKCSKIMTIEQFKNHDCEGLKINRRTIRLSSKYH